jgi:hypothetical protein
MVKMANRVLWSLAANQKSDDGLTTFYDIAGDGNYLAHNGIGRTGVRFDAGASGIGTPIRSVVVRFRKYGLPTGNITINQRNAADAVQATLGTWPIEHFPAGVENEIVVRLRSNAVNMAAGDRLSIEFPSNPTNGFEISTNSVEVNPINNYTSQSHNGTSWNATTSDPLAIIIKG